ncbi:MAG: DHH family phosphoesterase, partial [archaeon]
MKITLTKPEFIVGSEEKFLRFIRNIKKEDKVALVSHVADLDGLASAKIVNAVVKIDVTRYVDYQEIRVGLLEELKKLKVNKIIITDLFIKDPDFVKEVEKFAELLIIDHHSFERDYNSGKTTFLNAQEFCAAYLCYYLFSKIENLERYDWLVASASVSDWCYTNNKEWMQQIYNKYKQNFEPSIQGIKKSEFWNVVLTISRAIIYFRPKVEKVYSMIGEKFEDNKELEKYAKIIADEIEKILNK